MNCLALGEHGADAFDRGVEGLVHLVLWRDKVP